MLKVNSEFAQLFEKSGLTVSQCVEELGLGERTIRRYLDGSTSPSKLALRRMREINENRCPNPKKGNFRFIDLFAGIGGLRRPFEVIGGKCVFTAEWDRFCRETYMANFPEHAENDHVFAEDIKPWADNPARIPKHDVLLAGFPCQPFSIAGVSKKNALGRPHGFMCDTQGTLFYDVAKILKYHRPKAFLLENVKNLVRHDGGKTFATIMNVLENELGYSVSHRVIDSSPWVPQKRERIFIVGFDRECGFDFCDLVIPDGGKPILNDILEAKVPQKYTLSRHLWQYLKDYKEKHRRAGNGFGYSSFSRREAARTLSARYYKDGSEILIRQIGKRPRRLTPRECSRLMGFDGPGESCFQIPVSDAQAYKQFGNAVVVPVVAAVANLMKPHIESLVGKEFSSTINASSMAVYSGECPSLKKTA